MKKVSLILNPQEAASEEVLKDKVLRKARLPEGEFVIERKSIDARKAPVKVRIDALVGDSVDLSDTIEYKPSQNFLSFQMALLWSILLATGFTWLQ